MSTIKDNKKFKRKKKQTDPTNLNSHRDVDNKKFDIDSKTIKEQKSKS
ncbi:hypothetical protein UMM65_02585 [Aureibaculum sp. 2210JD6-5]|nr:hypothetical protein [Aureibaculum sp. 2210JD6-5]MDY7394112.1 hypothetical protein [Aureibaculum sp. 2210JD6-5]